MVPKSEGWSNRRKIRGFDSLDLDNPSDQILSRLVMVDYRFDFFLDHFVWNDPYKFIKWFSKYLNFKKPIFFGVFVLLPLEK